MIQRTKARARSWEACENVCQGVACGDTKAIRQERQCEASLDMALDSMMSNVDFTG